MRAQRAKYFGFLVSNFEFFTAPPHTPAAPPASSPAAPRGTRAAPPPPLPATVEGWARVAAGAVYILFYVVMIGMPLSGWALSSASVIIRFKPIMLYGLVEWPAIAPLTHLGPAAMKQAHEGFVTVHQLLAKLAYALIVLHVGAALRHLFLLKDGVMGRMVPFARAPVV